MKTKLITLATGAFLPAIAFAGEPVPMEQMMTTAPEMSWTGFYAGIQAGINFDTDTDGGLELDSNLDGIYGDNVPFGGPPGGGAFGRNFDHEFEESGSLGIVIGYDQQISRWVLGGILDYNHTDILESQNGFSSTPAFYREERTIENLSTLRFRAGYLITDRTLIYLTGGLAYGDPEYRFSSNNPNGTSTGDNDGDVGYVFGAGLETRITQNWSLTLEYLYTNFGAGDFVTSFNNGPFATAAGSTNARGSEQDFDFHTLQVKVTYRF